MKSEHRHELQTNELGKAVERLGTFMEVHGNRLMIGVLVVGLAAFVALFWYRRENLKRAAAWQEFAIAVRSHDVNEYHDVWSRHKGMPAGLWAAVHEGEDWLTQGVQSMFRNVEKGTSELEKSRDAFQVVLKDRGAPPEVRERALIGLGHALESLSSGNESETIETYEKLLKEFPDSIYKEEAQARVAQLKQNGPGFYTWFSKYPRPKPTEKLPHDKGTSGVSDDDLEDIARKLEALKPKGGKSADEDDDALKLPTDGQPEKKPALPDRDESEEESDKGTAPGSKADSEAPGEKQPAPDSQSEEKSESKDSADEE